jgi:uncharacterized protein involved in outer membrane biogenesis
MKASLVGRAILKWAAVVLVTLLVVTAGLVAVADSRLGRPLLIDCFAWYIERPIKVDGALEAHLFSPSPRVVAQQVTLGNPSWTPQGVALQADRISMVVRLPGLWHPGGITAIDVQGANLHLIRDAAGRANWQWRNPATRSVHRNSSILRSVSLPNAKVALDDALRHLQFTGTVSALNPAGDPQPLRIAGVGQLNGRAASFTIGADPLVTASHRTPYHFTFAERSGDSRLDGSGELPEPFAFELADATFVASGPDLKDLYFLTGVRLIDTGDYRLSGKVERRGTHTTFSDLIATSGSSDVRGRVASDSSSGRPRFDVDLRSRVLRLADLGSRAAGRAPGPPPPLVLSDAMISPTVLHSAGVVATFHASRLEVGHLALEEVSLNATVGQNVLTVMPFLGKLSGGRVDARLTLDDSKATAAASLDVRISDLQLGPLVQKGTAPPPLEGILQARVRISGQGRSVHQVAASANGTVTAQMSGGALRESFAEMTNVDLRGLGLLLAKDRRDVPVRCAVAKFKAQDGVLMAQNLLMDTDAVLINGEGQIHLDSEVLDLAIRGSPKKLRLLRFSSPVLVAGTLAHPSIRISVKHSHFMLADRGQADDVDCTALLAGGS